MHVENNTYEYFTTDKTDNYYALLIIIINSHYISILDLYIMHD